MRVWIRRHEGLLLLLHAKRPPSVARLAAAGRSAPPSSGGAVGVGSLLHITYNLGVTVRWEGRLLHGASDLDAAVSQRGRQRRPRLVNDCRSMISIYRVNSSLVVLAAMSRGAFFSSRVGVERISSSSSEEVSSGFMLKGSLHDK